MVSFDIQNLNFNEVQFYFVFCWLGFWYYIWTLFIFVSLIPNKVFKNGYKKTEAQKEENLATII